MGEVSDNDSPLRRARLNASLTQVEVAHKLGVTQQAVGSWETGKASPNGVVLAKLSRLYKTPTDALLGLDSNLYFKLQRRIEDYAKRLAAVSYCLKCYQEKYGSLAEHPQNKI